ncbi:YqaA family protein [Sphingomonas sp. ID0503]|uniref:YqaA family protein n=1 Tax=Sphingomonas sp. ID0503 TaxID=3399691 RepID=UPI003AFA45B4
MFQRIYDWTLRLAGHRHAESSLALISFSESVFFPVPADVMLVPMVIARPDRAWRIATICTIASVLGGVLGYMVGYFLFATVGKWVIDLYGLGHAFSQYHDFYAKWGATIILVKGLTPIPYKLVTIASGVAKFNFGIFLLTSAITRGARYFIVAALLKRYGTPIQAFIEKRLTLVSLGVLALIVGGFVAVALL